MKTETKHKRRSTESEISSFGTNDTRENIKFEKTRSFFQSFFDTNIFVSGTEFKFEIINDRTIIIIQIDRIISTMISRIV